MAKPAPPGAAERAADAGLAADAGVAVAALEAVLAAGLVFFAALVLVIHSIMSHSAYRIHRQLSIFVLSLGILLLILMIIVSNALLVLR